MLGKKIQLSISINNIDEFKELCDRTIKDIEELKAFELDIKIGNKRVYEKDTQITLAETTNHDVVKKLDIREACRIAATTGQFITRRSKEGEIWFKIEPTDSDYWLCAILHSDGTEKTKGWQPSLADLIATDWEVVG